MNCVSCDIGVYHLRLFVFVPWVFLRSRVAGACPVTPDLMMMRVNVRTTTNNNYMIPGTRYTALSAGTYNSTLPGTGYLLEHLSCAAV